MIEVTEEMVDAAALAFTNKPTETVYVIARRMLKAALETHEANKPKPEAVGYIYKHSDGNTYFAENENKLMMFVLMDPGLSKEMLIGELMDAHSMPLYTTPPTREPLSQSDLGIFIGEFLMIEKPLKNLSHFARIIEKAHGIGVK